VRTNTTTIINFNRGSNAIRTISIAWQWLQNNHPVAPVPCILNSLSLPLYMIGTFMLMSGESWYPGEVLETTFSSCHVQTGTCTSEIWTSQITSCAVAWNGQSCHQRSALQSTRLTVQNETSDICRQKRADDFCSTGYEQSLSTYTKHCNEKQQS
jgi:hypothetical protein